MSNKRNQNTNKPDLSKFSVKSDIIAIIVAICFLIIPSIIYSEITKIKVTAKPTSIVDTNDKTDTTDSYATHHITGSNWDVGKKYTGTYNLIDVNTNETVKTHTVTFTPKLDNQDIDVKIPLTSDEYKRLFDTGEYKMYCDVQNNMGDYIIYHSY